MCAGRRTLTVGAVAAWNTGRQVPKESDVIFTEVAPAAEAVHESTINAPAIGLLAFAGLVGLLLVTYAFRSVGTRH